jgi:DNA end-binding protein Ku
VKAYPAVSSTSASHFHLLHADCGQRISYAKTCPHHGLVDAEAIVRGFEFAADQYVVLEPEELENLRPARDKALILEQFLPLTDIEPTLFAGRTLYLLPGGAAAQHPYGVLATAFQRTGRGALGHVVLNSRRQLVLVRVCSRLLVLDVLHYPAQVRHPASWEADVPASVGTETEQALAEQLIALASGPVDWTRFRDSSAEELTALIEAKRAQQPPPAAAADEPVVLRLLDALKQSVAAACQNTAPAEPKTRKPRARKALA